MIRVGVIGTGFGRFVHVPAFLALPNVQVVGITSAHPERAQAVAQLYKLPRSFASWQELVSSPEIDAVSIATPPSVNERIVGAALRQGKAVLCEKPLANTAPEAERLWQLAQQAQCVNMVDFEFRELPAWRYAHHLIHSGILGPLRHVQIEWVTQNWSDASRPASWKTDIEQGGGILRSMVAHVFDYVEWFLLPIRSMSAHITTRIAKRPDQSGQLVPVDAEDSCSFLMELADSTPVSALVSVIAVQGTGHCLTFFGEKASLRLGSSNLRDFGAGFEVSLGSGAGWQPQPIPTEFDFPFAQTFEDGRIAPFLSLATRFIRAVEQHDLTCEPNFAQGVRVQRLLDYAEQAQHERRWIECG